MLTGRQRLIIRAALRHFSGMMLDNQEYRHALADMPWDPDDGPRPTALEVTEALVGFDHAILSLARLRILTGVDRDNRYDPNAVQGVAACDLITLLGATPRQGG